MSCQCGTCGNGCNNYTTPTSFSGVDISGSTFTGGSIQGSTLSGCTVSASSVTGLTVDTIADLTALDVATASSHVVVLGFAAAGDGGGGIFWYDSTSVEPEDGGTIFAPDSGAGRWIRL